MCIYIYIYIYIYISEIEGNSSTQETPNREIGFGFVSCSCRSGLIPIYVQYEPWAGNQALEARNKDFGGFPTSEDTFIFVGGPSGIQNVKIENFTMFQKVMIRKTNNFLKCSHGVSCICRTILVVNAGDTGPCHKNVSNIYIVMY